MPATLHDKLALSMILVSLVLSSLFSQPTRPDPVFSTFKGPVYKMPIVKQQRGKGFTIGIIERYIPDSVKNYKVIKEIELETPNIPNSDSVDGFPGHPELTTQFAMLLDSEVTIKVPGCYQFRLKSDDGSILWIDDKKIVDNDGGHAMTTKTDTVRLQAGTYPSKLWYFQGHAAKFGIQLTAKLIGQSGLCSEPNDNADIKLNLESEILFDSGSFALIPSGEEEIRALCDQISESPAKKIQIIGHTDDIGSSEDNQLLSLKRAQTIKSALQICLSNPEIVFQAIGKGETAPLTLNDSTENRSKNRRVEIVIEH